MRAPRVWLRNWIHNALYVEEGWPYEPLNRGILLGFLYVIVPVFVFVVLTLHLTGWIHAIPIWLSLPPFVYGFVAGWIALDEWRSRRRADNGHGWLWQIVAPYRPRRRFNQFVLAAICVAFAAAALLHYLDRFTARDLQSMGAVRLVEAMGIVFVDLWLIGLTVGIFRWAQGLTYWGVILHTVVAMVCVNALLSVGDGAWPWSILPLILVLVLGIPGWLVHVVWRWRTHARKESSAGKLTAETLPPWW